MKIAINTIGQTSQWFYLMRRNQLWVGIKIMPKVLLFKYLPSILIYNIASLPYHAIRGRGRLIMKAYLDARQGLSNMLSGASRFNPLEIWVLATQAVKYTFVDT